MEEGIALIPSADMVSDTHALSTQFEGNVPNPTRGAAVLGILLSCDASLRSPPDNNFDLMQKIV